MYVAVCDDLKECLEETKQAVEQIDYVKKIDLFTNIDYLYEEIKGGKQYDVVLMDIDWKKDRTGIDFAEDLYKISPYTKIIYVTAYTIDYVEDVFLKASNLSGFLMKPVNIGQLNRNLEKIKREKDNREGKLIIRHKGNIHVIPFSDIYYVESQLHKVIVHTKHMDYEGAEKLDYIQERLNDRFLRCHKSYLVHMERIREFNNSGILLENQEVIPVSKKRYSESKRLFFEYVSEKM